MSDSKDKEPEVLFVGDSLVQLMHQFGVNTDHTLSYVLFCAQCVISSLVLIYNEHVDALPLCFSLQIWRQLFSPLHALNFGVGGDATQHVLWRLSNGELDNISPKVQITAKNREHDHARLFRQ